MLKALDMLMVQVLDKWAVMVPLPAPGIHCRVVTVVTKPTPNLHTKMQTCRTAVFGAMMRLLLTPHPRIASLGDRAEMESKWYVKGHMLSTYLWPQHLQNIVEES